MNPGTKGMIWGMTVGVLAIVLSYVLPVVLCPDFFRTGPAYPIDQPFRALLIMNPLRSHYPFPAILFPWFVCLMISTMSGWGIGRLKGGTHHE
jgi:hypothetical protein